MLQLTRSGALFSGRRQDLENLRTEFDRQHCLVFRELLNREILAFLSARMPQASFNSLLHQGIGTELCLADSVSLGLLYFLTNNQKLFDIIDQATGCGRIGCFQGRVYRMVPREGHHDSWHNDLIENRLIGMSINLGAHPYSGGIFQLRDRPSKKVLYQVANTGLGDAIVFRLRKDLEHMVTHVDGDVDKTAFAGWFKSSPDFSAVLAARDEPGGTVAE